MSFVEFLLDYYVWILVVLVIAIITVIGFLADARLKKKKLQGVKTVDGNVGGSNNSPVIPQPINEQSIMSNLENSNQSVVGDFVAPVGDISLNSQTSNNVSVGQEQLGVETPVMPVEPIAPVVQTQPQVVTPVMPVEPIAPVVQTQPQAVTPVMPVEPIAPVVQTQPQAVTPVMPVEPIAPVVQTQPQAVTPVMPVEPIAPVVQTQPQVVTPVMPVEPIPSVVQVQPQMVDSTSQQVLNDFNAADMFVTGNNN